MKHCCLQGSLRVWSWSCSSCLRDLRSWRARDWENKCREQLGEPSKEPFLKQQQLPQRPPEDEHVSLRQDLYILWLKASKLTLLKKHPKWTVAKFGMSFQTYIPSPTFNLAPMFVIDIQTSLKRPPLDGKMWNICISVWSLPFSSQIMQHFGAKSCVSGPRLKKKKVSRSKALPPNANPYKSNAPCDSFAIWPDFAYCILLKR